MGVFEVHFPWSFLTVDDNAIVYMFNTIDARPSYNGKLLTEDGSTEQQPFIRDMKVPGLKITKVKNYLPAVIIAKLLSGNYTSDDDVIDSLNSHKQLVGQVSFEYDTKQVEIKCEQHVD